MARGRDVVGLALLAAVIAPLACRDDVDPFRPDDRPAAGATVRLTYSPGDDRGPTWSSDGDSVYYSAESFETQPDTPFVLLRVPRASGSATPLLPGVQGSGSATDYLLVAPALHRGTGRLAYIELVELWGPRPCSINLSLGCSPPLTEEEAQLPPIREIAVRVREPEAVGPPGSDSSLELEIAGVEFVGTGVRTAEVKNYPFQRLFAESAATAIRASWAPDGERLVFSDGLRLVTWTVGDDSVTPIPNSQDGVWAAWSPDGAWIAFTRIVRADSTGASCDYRGQFNVLVCVQERTDYLEGRHILTLIRPDGTGLQDLGDGDEPAWSPDGSTLYFHREGRIWRSAADGSNAVPLAGTEGGHEPAISPDGRFLAFTRQSPSGTYDVWVTELER